jgi:hypothetical protein
MGLLQSFVIYMSPFDFFGLPLFSSEVFFDDPVNEGSKSTPLFMAPFVCAKALVEYQANRVSYFDLGLA